MHAHTHISLFPVFYLRPVPSAPHRDAPPCTIGSRVSLPLQTLMHRLSSCSCTTPRRRRQGETIAFVGIRLPFTPYFASPCSVIFPPQSRRTIEIFLSQQLRFTIKIVKKLDVILCGTQQYKTTKSIWIWQKFHLNIGGLSVPSTRLQKVKRSICNY